MPPKLVGLIANTNKSNASYLIRTLFEKFREKKIALKLTAETAVLIGQHSNLNTLDLGRDCDLIVVLGGDGTLLQAVHDLRENLKPVLGINLGSLGFLTCVGAPDYTKAIECIAAGNFVISLRSRLRVIVERDGEIIGERFGLNDAVISRGELSRLIRLDTRVDGVPLTEFNADGLIVSTPTGSTAYSLSAGGPILMPESGVFVITPICPHVLTNRSVIVSDRVQIEITSVKPNANVFLTVDGQELVPINTHDRIRIERAPTDLPLVMLPDLKFSQILREKLKWSGSAV